MTEFDKTFREAVEWDEQDVVRHARDLFSQEDPLGVDREEGDVQETIPEQIERNKALALRCVAAAVAFDWAAQLYLAASRKGKNPGAALTAAGARVEDDGAPADGDMGAVPTGA